MVYNDDVPSFEEFLTSDNSFTTHVRNTQALAIDLYKLVNGPEIMKL